MQSKDWHPEDIKCELRKRGYSLRKLSVESGLAPATLSNVLRVPYPKAENIIASVLNVAASDIWPSRYSIKE